MHHESAISTQPVRWGILGAANIAVQRIVPGMLATTDQRLVGLASRNPQRAQDLFAHVPDLRIYSSYQELLDDPEIEAIYNPLPNTMHAEWTIKALHAGKHVLCEKPFALTAQEGALMVEAARTTGKLLMEGFSYRVHPQLIWALEQLHAGRLGTIRLVRVSCSFNIFMPPDPHNIRLQLGLGGGSMTDLGCYAINLCRAIYGRQPNVVAARVHAPEPGMPEQTAAAVLDYGDGCLGVMDVSIVQPERHIAEIVGDLGTLTIPIVFGNGEHENVLVLAMEGGETIHQTIPPADMYRLEIEHFGACIRSGTAPLLSLEETLDNLATLEDVYRAAGYAWPPV